jgi:uncharacterized protein (DUF2235 family)
MPEQDQDPFDTMPILPTCIGKNIVTFSDGTGQYGGLRPHQRLSNIYKMYRAMPSGGQTGFDPSVQVEFYDPGLGSGELGGRVRNILAAAFGTGIAENIIVHR